MEQIILITLSVALYNILLIALRVPKFNSYRARNMMSAYAKQGILSDFIDTLSSKLAKHINLSIMKKAELNKLISLAKRSETAEEFTAKCYVSMALPLLLLPIVLINPLLLGFPILFSFYMYRRNHNLLREDGQKRQRNIENEILKFTVYMANSFKTERNIIRLIEQYKSNFNTPLTEELTYTLSEMKTSNYEKALMNMSRRNNSNAVTRLVNGLISSLQGNDMGVYFENLSYELSAEWEQNLKAQAMKQEPKISRLSLIIFAVAAVTIFAILITGLTSSDILFGGM